MLCLYTGNPQPRSTYSLIACSIWCIYINFIVYIIMSTNCPIAFVKCPDCEYISKSTGGLAVHRSKIHNINIPNDIDTLYINRLFPEGKPVYCCICDVVIGSVANFRRHMKNIHKCVKLVESAQCLVCNKRYNTGRGAGVHLRTHNMDINSKYPHSHTPVMTSTTKDQTSSPCKNKKLTSHVQASNSSPSDSQVCHLELDDSVSITPTKTKPKSHKSFTQLEALVVLSDCTKVESNITPIPLTLFDNNNNDCADELYSPSPCSPINLDITPSSCTQSTTLITSQSPNTQYSTDVNQLTPLTSMLDPLIPPFTPPQPVQHHPVEMIDLDPNCADDDEDVEHSRPNFVPSTSHNSSTNINTSSLSEDDPPLTSDIPFSPSSNSNNNSEFVNTWSSRIRSTDSFEAFSFQCEKFAEAVVEEAKAKPSNTSKPKQRANRPNNKDINRNRPRVLPNPIEARRIQTLYRLSKKRAARQILNDNNTVYSGTKDQANEYFKSTFSSNAIDIDEVLQSLKRHVPTANEDPTIMEPMTEKTIKNKVKMMSNSAPGKDRVEYRHLRQVDPNCKVLAHIFNRCLSQKQIPAAWKTSTTILIYKKGNV